MHSGRPADASPPGSRPGEHDPDRHARGAGVLDPPLERPDRERARLEVAADHRAQLLADESHTKDVRLEGLPGAREERVVGAGPLGSVQPQAGSVSGRSVERTVATPPDSGRPTKIEKASAATGANACLPTSRCQRAKSPRCVRPMLPDLGRRSEPRPTTRRRSSGPRRAVAGIGHGQADRPAAGATDRGQSFGPHRTPRLARHLSTPVTTTPRMNARCAEEEDDDRHGHGHERGSLDEGRLRRIARCIAGSPIDSGWSSGLVAEVQERHEEVVPGEEEVEQADRDDRRDRERHDDRAQDPERPAPSIIAASSRSRGIDMKYWRSRKTL